MVNGGQGKNGLFDAYVILTWNKLNVRILLVFTFHINKWEHFFVSIHQKGRYVR